MSALSSIANILANSGLIGGKNDAKKEDRSSFLSLLSGGGGTDILANDPQTSQSLVELLDRSKDDIQPVAVEVPPAAQLEIVQDMPQGTGRQPAIMRSESRNEAPESRDAVSENTPNTKPVERSKNTSKDNSSEKTEQNNASAKEGGAPTEKTVQTEKSVSDNEGALDGLAEKIRAKIGELSDILSALSALLGVGGGMQLTQVQITQTAITTTTAVNVSTGVSTGIVDNHLAQAALGVTQAFLDVSDRFKQLIAAINASQNVPSVASDSLSLTFRSFQALFISLSNNNQNVALPAFEGQFLASCKSCETQLTIAAATIASVGGKIIPAGLDNQLQKLQQWMGSFQNIAKEINAVKAQDVNVVVPQVQPITSEVIKPVIATAPTAVNDNQIELISPASAVEADPVTAGVQSVAPQAASTIPAVAVVANNAGAETNLSGGNNGQGGQGNAGAQTASVAALSTPNNVQNAQAPAFAKALHAATHKPVVEQVAFNIKTAVKDGVSKIEIKLDPESLGKVSIKLDVDNAGKTVVSVTADHKSTLDLLQRDSRGLEQALSDAGLKADSGSLSFNLRGGNQNQNDDQHGKFSGYASAAEEEVVPEPLAVVSKDYVMNVSDGLDIKI